MRVIIAGGGTGGLATAIALRKAGIEPLVLEQAPAFTAIGAGLGLLRNAMKALTYLGGRRPLARRPRRASTSPSSAASATTSSSPRRHWRRGRRNTASPTTAATAPTC